MKSILSPSVALSEKNNCKSFEKFLNITPNDNLDYKLVKLCSLKIAAFWLSNLAPIMKALTAIKIMTIWMIDIIILLVEGESELLEPPVTTGPMGV